MKGKLTKTVFTIAMFVLFSQFVIAQVRVTGRITDSITGTPLESASVREPGQANGVVTNENGEYSIQLSSAEALLEVSFVGYQSQVIPLNGETSLDILLVPDYINLEEVVVVGYGVQKKSDISGSIVSIDADDLAQQSSTSISELLRGKASGVYITQGNARPGGWSNITIRGTRSLNGGNSPLFVLDGVPVSDVDNVNINDIATIEVLKDAASTAIYGARAANGVVLVTTKRAKANTFQVDVSTVQSLHQLKRNFDVYSPDEWAQLRREAVRTKNGGEYPTDEQAFPAAILSAIKNNQTADWEKLMIRDAWQRHYNASVRSGTDRTRLLFSAANMDQQGLARDAGYNRTNFRLNLDHQLLSNLTLGGNIAYSYGKQTFEDGSWDGFYRHLTAPPYATPYDENGNLNYIIGESNSTNPLWNSQESSNVSRYNNLLANMFVEWDILEDLSYKLNTSVNNNGSANKFYQTSLHQNGRIYNGNGSVSESKNTDFLLENILSYNKDMDIHRLDVTLVQSINKIRYESIGTSATDFPSDIFGADGIGSAQEANIPTRGISDRKILSFMGRLRYSMLDKYLATFTMRADGSSVFGANNKFGYFPSGSLMWRVSQEEFLKESLWLDDLKLRVSYGAVGNQAISPYNSLGVTVLYQGILMNNAGTPAITSGFLPSSSLYNPDLKWETSLSSNIGLDFGLLNNRISGSIEYYNTRTIDLLVNKSLPNILGYTSQTVNLGEVRNSGVEVMVNLVPLMKNDLQWNVGLMFSRNVNKLVKIDGRTDEEGKPLNDLRNNWFIGESVNSYFDYKFAGIWQASDQAFMDAHPTLNAQAGDVRVEDLNNDDLINEDDKILYNRDPKFIASLNSSFKFKGFDLYWDLYWVNGVYKLNHYLFDSNSGGALTGLTNGLKVDYWTPENPSNTAPRPRESGMNNPYLNVTGYQDASYVRLRNVTLGYTLPASLASQAFVKSLRIYAGLENFLTFTDYQSYSPESNPGDYPEARVVQFGLDITF
ncbi:TonB-linked SusC/RagA family outer membrane protein [Anseongella ginsenosidimutans]|uniref:TonB-linked SusC/RagA family outer membrane protein n=1 Tax=Anseongella ginsenosidimutans TaxID=496056 RepID=A0A4R3KW61_9SPHI|nr:TonB-dependent receptor [Anseongella ginsenosidimutans]QEC51327.1 TonB-dependent receptor [Anseongella ginsenosidimutans]TCS89979.1 TonB-linked SusC/RagA family outer membrane protein [Anseongella ginsenosidimutans]